jgi:hypothetical protein
MEPTRPKANFKISLRELPDEAASGYCHGRSTTMVCCSIRAIRPQASTVQSVYLPRSETPQTVTIKKAGVYQVDLYTAARSEGSYRP